jgi:amino acid adenylation domain-containing protein
MIGGAGLDLAGPLAAAGAAVSALAAEEVNETVLDHAAAAARRGDPPDFLVLFTALDALAAGAGAGAICGAFARERSARGEMPVTAIHWGRGLTVEERLDALGRILESGLPEVVVSPGDLASDLATVLRAAAAPAEALAEAAAPGRKRHPRPALQTPWAAAATATEETVAALWGELLGIEPIGVHDNFFELGGHSLLGLQAVSRIQARLGFELSLRTLFEAPTVAALAAEVDACRLRGETAAAAAFAAVPRDGRLLPLSFAQQRLWFIDQLEPGSPLYNLPAVLRAEGPLSPTVLARCLGEVVRRHEALRTVFALVEGMPVQVIQPAAPFLLPVVDLAGLPESPREAAARALAGEEAGRPFDLSRSFMLRGVLLRLAEEDHVVALTMHHIASDGWSIGILIHEVTVLYDARAEDSAGRPSPLPELPVQYADFSAWQSSWLRGEVLENEISFWRRQLAGLPPLLELPTDRPRPAVQSYRGASRALRLPAALTRQAEALGRHEGATFFMVLLAGFQALLARSSGQDDLATGSPIAGRNRVETEDLIGFFVNTLVLRGDLTSAPSFRELLGRTRETALSAYLHQDLPFEKLVEELAPERSLAQTPLFQVMLVLQNAPMGSLEIRDLRLRLLTAEVTTSKLDLTVNVTERDGALDGEIEYATDLFDAATVDRLAGHFERLLAAAVEAPERRTAELPLLSAAERGQILLEWNDTGAAVPRLPPEAGAPELFAAQARRTPDAVAVVCGNDLLTYAELAGRAGRLARHLRRLGVGPDVLVGLFVERSLDMVVGVLGILQAGGAYVPLDPGYPDQRLAFMLDDTRAPVVVTQEPLRGRLPAGGGFTAVLLDGGEVAPHPRRLSPPQGLDFPLSRAVGGGWERGPGGEELAYVIYTSGSTGRPKGVALSHGALRNLIDWHLATCLGGVRTLQIASMSFDVSFYEMFACWGSGGTLVVVAEELRRDMPALAGLLVEQGVEKAVFPVAVFAQLAEIFAGRAELPPLREITTTGERLQTNRAMAALLDRLPGCVFHNQYGPTETHVATAFTLPSGPGCWPVFPAIGRPIWSSTAYVLEPGLEPAPLGVPGDLHLGGACVARGYLGRPALTAERFVPDPFSTVPGGRLYRTGDKVRLAVGGELEYLGRFDHQVKIRGFRIEPGEIEEALLALPGVGEAVVVAREDQPAGERRLVAYVVGTATAEELRSALREQLPDYMVPAAFVTLAAFPLTPNRKVDRKALPAPEWQGAGEGHAAPRTPVEEVLAGIWAELLGLERVGADGSFFELGGHSLLAAQVMSRLRGAFGVEMPLRDLFEAPTPAGLAVRVELARRAAGAAGAAPSLVPLVPVHRQGPLPLSFAQRRLWLIDQLAPGSPMYHMPLVLRVEGPLDPAVLARSLSAVVRRHEALRTVFTVLEGERPGGTPVQVVRPAVPFVLPVVDLSGLPESRREALALLLAQQEALRPFDLARDPLLRGVLLRLADSGEIPDHVAALTMHHIVSDGWSLGILVREVTILYAAFAAGRPSPLLELPVQYADFSVWQGSWLRGELLENEIAFWRRQLAGLPPHLDLPTDRPRSTMRSLRGTSRPVRLPAGIARPAEALARREGATLFMVLLAGFQALLARLSGQDDLAVGSPIAARNRVETEGLIGFFVNTLVLRGDLSGAPTFRELLGRTRETALAAYLHQDVPFEKLVEELVPERSLAQTPLFQVMLVLQNVPVESLEIESLRLRPVDVEAMAATVATGAKFDLTLNLAEHGGALAGTVEYATALFDATTIGRLTGCFERLLAAALAAPELPALELALLSAAEQHQLLREWSDTAAFFPREATLHGLFAEQAALSPDAVAVEQGGERLTYGELLRRAGRIARRLVARGLRPEERVAVAAERSPNLIAALLGILQAGGAYLPLDPVSPAERLHWMLRDADATLLVDMLDPRDDDEEPRAGPSLLALPKIPAESLACVMYTSGSTGTPKGVAVTHRNVIRLVRGAGYADLGPEQTWLQYAPVSFDASTLEIWAPLLNGGRLVLFPGRTGPLDELARVVETHGVTSAWLTAGLFHEMVDGCLAGLRPLSQLLAGGDVISPVHARRALEAHPGLTLIDGYGPTEGTTFTCCHRMTEARQVGGDGIPIGRPIGNAQVRVLDERLAPVPIGAWGELSAGGDGLARGYLGRPELTAERFVPDAFGEAGSRLYRTGDRVRHRADGLLEFSGRLDGQVKIRGFRIEPGEIEAALVAHPGVREAVVVARRDRDREIRLVAYVAGNVPGMAAEELRRHLRERLPEPMVPAAFVVLAALPLTANGKVDRKALPAPAEAAGELQASHLPPRTDLEERIARVWCEVLGVERVGVHDGFFDLGGHSLLLLRVVSRLREVLGRDLPNVLLFEYPTVASLAAVLGGSPNLPAAPAPDLEHSRDRAAAGRESLRRLQRRGKRNA